MTFVRGTRVAGSVATFVYRSRKQNDAAARLNSLPANANATALYDCEARVDCASCVEPGVCCKAYIVTLALWENGEGLDTVVLNGERRLRRHADGSCVHLIDNRCSVHTKRPQACRTYDCREMSLAGIMPRPILTEVVEQWKWTLATIADQEMHERVAGLMRLFTAFGVLPETAAANAVDLASYPQEEISARCECVIDKFGRDDGPKYREVVEQIKQEFSEATA